MNRIFLIIFLFIGLSLIAETDGSAVSEQRSLEEFNSKLSILKTELTKKYGEANLLGKENAENEKYRSLLLEIKAIRDKIFTLQDTWRKDFADSSPLSEEGYALWDIGEATISQLVMEYGSVDYVYVVPPELLNMKLNIFSGISVPREAWNKMLEAILAANGIGTKQLNPYVKQLYILKHNSSRVSSVCTSQNDLDLVDSSTRVFYVFSPDPDQIKGVQSFFERFSDPKDTTIQVIGFKIALVSSKDNIEKLLSLYDAIWEKDSSKVIRVINLKKIEVGEAEKIIKSFFPAASSKLRSPLHLQISNELTVHSIPQGLVLIGELKAIERAEEALKSLEDQLTDPYEMTVYWYNCKHSDPLDVANVLEQVYDSLVKADFSKKKTSKLALEQKKESFNKTAKRRKTLPVSPNTIEPAKDDLQKQKTISHDTHFIVDSKTGSILMVVRKDQLGKIKSLLKKIDVPKKMVQIDVLLIEKKQRDRSQSGINLLKLGSNVTRKETAVSFDTNERGVRKGILDFILARKNLKYFPSFDLTYNFLMSQNDVKINANPSILAINQTPATISIVEEISINNGAVLVDKGNDNRSEKSFTRAQYGTILKMTPTIHLSNIEDEDARGFITLSTDITFDTTETSTNDRPPVTRRSIKNEVTVADGETIILGGLRRKTSEKHQEKIPFLGDIPGIGKLFGSTTKTDQNTEMFIFITPKIVRNPIEDLRLIRTEELKKRAGDTPEFLRAMEDARDKEKKKLFENSLKLIFDPGE